MKTKIKFPLLCIVFFLFAYGNSGLGQITLGTPNYIIGETAPYFNGVGIGGLADIDMDGDLDMPIFNNNSVIRWLENLDGNTRLGTYPNFISDFTGGSEDVILMDVDGDGDLDVVTASSFNSANFINWIENLDGLGQFDGTYQPISPMFQPDYLETIDVEADGDEDLFFANKFSVRWVKKVEGSELFNEAGTVSDSLDDKVLLDLKPADLNDDQFTDVVIATNKRLIISMLSGVDTTFNNDTVVEDLDSLVFRDIAVEDFDGDGDMDITAIIKNNSENKAELYLYENQDGQGTFSDRQLIFELTGIELIADEFYLEDLNSDGTQDIVYVDIDNLSWSFRTSGTSSFSTFSQLDDQFIFIKEFIDMDQDGDLDIIGEVNGKIIILERDGPEMSFKKRVSFTKPFDVVGATYLADLNMNGSTDFISFKYDGALSWFQNINNKFCEHLISEDLFAINTPVAWEDIDGDGDTDLVTYSEGYDFDIEADFKRILFVENLDGEGWFAEPVLLFDAIGTFGTLEQVNHILAEDFDGDTDIDIIYSCNDNRDIFLMERQDNSFIGPTRINPSFTDVIATGVGDVDNDGDVDLYGTFYTGFSSQSTTWIENIDGQGTFADPQNLGAPVPGKWGDLDNDGDLDHLAIAFDGYTVYLNEGSAFTASGPVSGDFLNGNREFDLGDMDGDQDLDLVITTYNNESEDTTILYIYENIDATGNFLLSSTHYYTIGDIDDFKLVDFDNDGDADILINSEDENIQGFDRVFTWIQNLTIETSLSGQCYYDENENAVRDTNEIGLVNQTILVQPSAINTYSSEDGTFKFFVGTGPYTVELLPKPNWYITTSPEMYSIDVLGGNTTPVNFGLAPLAPLDEVTAHLTAAPTRCSFEVPFWARFANSGTTTLNGDMILELDPLTIFISANPEPDSMQGDRLVWNFEDLPPSYDQSFELILKMPDAMFIGDSIKINARSRLVDEQGAVIDEGQWDETFWIINCAYDPNDKLVQPTGIEEDHLTLFGETFDYTIRFQNTGTDTAFNIFIRDTLDSDLDWNTFEAIDASHPYEATLNRNNGALEFKFDHILLPDSTTNELLSHGFVRFKIDHLPGLAEATKIENTAFIYFDFNAPIQTNTTLNTLTSFPTSTQEINPDGAISILPNPYSNSTLIKLEGALMEKVERIELFDIAGKFLKRGVPDVSGTYLLEDESIPEGLILLKAVDNNGKVLTTKKIIRIKE